MTSLVGHVLPAAQRRDPAALTDHLDLGAGDRTSKVSAFWTMLVLSGFIAVAGVLADSTATVIGAMIIAPLSIPIMGMALGIVQADRSLLGRSAAYVAGGLAAVVGIGVLAAVLLPESYDLLGNGQITGRTSPGILDMVAALATGLAGAVGLSRRDVSDVLPGVAIAISLVPPLGVVGVCLGEGQVALALGALLLFLSNVVALVLAGTLVFTAYGYAAEAAREGGLRRRRAHVAVAVGLVLVLVPLAANTAANVLIAVWTQRVWDTAEAWIAQTPGGRLVDVEVTAFTAVVEVEWPDGSLPETEDLLDALDGQVPRGTQVVVDAGIGVRIEAGSVGVQPAG